MDKNLVSFQMEAAKRNAPEILSDLYERHQKTGECGAYEITPDGKLGKKLHAEILEQDVTISECKMRYAQWVLVMIRDGQWVVAKPYHMSKDARKVAKIRTMMSRSHPEELYCIKMLLVYRLDSTFLFKDPATGETVPVYGSNNA